MVCHKYSTWAINSTNTTVGKNDAKLSKMYYIMKTYIFLIFPLGFLLLQSTQHYLLIIMSYN